MNPDPAFFHINKMIARLPLEYDAYGFAKIWDKELDGIYQNYLDQEIF